MDKIIIQGGKPLIGELEVSGAKNAALPILAATLLSGDEHLLKGVPGVVDVSTIQRLLRKMGAQIEEQDGVLSVRIQKIENCEAPYQWVKTMRAAILVLGPLLARGGEAHVSLPGGCAIGARPIQLHLSALEKMGAEVKIEHGIIHAKSSRLKGANIYFDISTVTGTENIMMAATLAEGTTVLENSACEPEIIDLAHFLIACGAKISGAGTDRITIEGVESLTGASYRIMPDRIEAGTFMIAAAITKGDLAIRFCRPETLVSVIDKLRTAGAIVTEEGEMLRVKGGEIHAVDIKTLPYPGLPTDMQAQFMALMSLSDGLSVITETIFEQRFNHVAELRRMGAEIRLEGNHAVIRGVKSLSGAPVMASDLRASASLVLAGLVAQGETEILRIYHLDRGYHRIEEKLSKVGASIRRVKGSG
ncbi:MAG: UDP-N-acetylglucosamine 1-carboxyvinyltransferase [Nitrospira sp.]|nr:UDP-N-acetylglucosamine 1-carboxyvinyltransferase [Candidatus Manganitrophaceae bacterium]HIL34672.1 UDP-N-acetylglucosamine 1-carboxyvinyltransferase [Candidatus Manganitrophaceae bacterium]